MSAEKVPEADFEVERPNLAELERETLRREYPAYWAAISGDPSGKVAHIAAGLLDSVAPEHADEAGCGQTLGYEGDGDRRQHVVTPAVEILYMTSGRKLWDITYGTKPVEESRRPWMICARCWKALHDREILKETSVVALWDQGANIAVRDAGYVVARDRYLAWKAIHAEWHAATYRPPLFGDDWD